MRKTMRTLHVSLFHAFLIVFMAGTMVMQVQALDTKEYKVFIVLDTQLDKFVEVQEGFKASLDTQLAAVGAKAAYTCLDTKLDPAQAATVVEAIKAGKPDLICTVNWPSAFADRNVALKLTDPAYRFVSLNATPLQSGAAKTWQRPGGNITGVGVFLQFDSMLKVAKRLRPQLKEVAFSSWSAMKDLNAYFEAEIRAACQRTGLTLREFRLQDSFEDEVEWLLDMDRNHPDLAIVNGISARFRRHGSAPDLVPEVSMLYATRIRNVLSLTYDETPMKFARPVGTCVIWSDLGAQLGEKGFRILSGANPGDMAWDYPRTYNLMFNQALAKLIGITIPPDLLGAAYRVYTDPEGNYAGR